MPFALPIVLFPTLLTHVTNHSQAQTWVDKMSASEPDEPNDKDFEGRPSRYIVNCFLFLALLDNWYVTVEVL